MASAGLSSTRGIPCFSGPSAADQTRFSGIGRIPSHPSMQAYNAVYVIDGSRASQLQSFPNGNHIYGDMMEKKAVNMP
ncbi:hypothetical protein HPP92_009452 [Vanilla planifolia]|uniref:Uncharacterized protein n=1 Tax=Vanilla planifolia TaxID=51239 RepID=A0A835V6M6_VANPL|nr:hypothetical protein HPP92_009452 [Vanilla planifolia]